MASERTISSAEAFELIKAKQNEYESKGMTLSTKINLAYEIFQLSEVLLKDASFNKMPRPELSNLQETMLKFLKSNLAFEDSNVHHIHKLMSYKLKKNKVNPEYIPGKSPSPLIDFIRPEMAETKAA